MLTCFLHAAPSMMRPAVWPCGRVAVWPCGRVARGAGRMPAAFISVCLYKHGGGGLGLKTKNYGSRLPSEKRKMTI